MINPGKRKNKQNIKEIIHNQKTHRTDMEIATVLNNYFTTIGKELANKYPTTKGYRKYMKHSNKNSFFLKAMSEQDVIDKIKNLSPKKAGGHDNITPKLLKEAIAEVSQQITHVINLSFKNAAVPKRLKIAKVIPCFKKKSKEESKKPSNYRPISLLSTIHKLLEKCMHEQLMTFLEKNNILFKYQFGFRRGYSTILALTEIIDQILNHLEENDLVAGIYCDFSKAFDTVDHGILLDKLHHYGIRGHANKWFESYLSNRLQYTYVNGTKSECQDILYGVPQGSVLGPLLFLVYTNDMQYCITEEDCHLKLFADDSNAFVIRNTYNELKNAITQTLRDLIEWSELNKLTINYDKTCYTIFVKHGQTVPNYLNNIKIKQHTIKKEAATPFLGLIVDERLTWKEHLDSLNEKLLKITNSFKIIKHYIPDKAKYQFYYAYIYSRIQYGIEVYGVADKKYLKQIQIRQNRSLKVLFSKDFHTPTVVLHKDLSLLMVKDIHKLNILKFVYKHQISNLPEIFKTFFKNLASYHDYEIRDKSHLEARRNKNTYGEKCMQSLGPSMWNSLPKHMKTKKTLKAFNRSVKQMIIADY